MRQSIKYKNSTIAFQRFGNGEKTVFCFHGFSLSSEEYAGLGKNIGESVSLFALDFPLHGETVWKENELLVEDFIQIFQSIYLQSTGIKLDKFWLMGHSLGGRICLTIYQNYSDRVERMILCAPDGLVIPIWYKMIFNFSALQGLFWLLCKSSKAMSLLGKIVYKLKLINKSAYNLIQSSLGSKELADLLFKRVMSTKKFQPNIATIKEKIATSKTKVYLFFGYYDSIIPKKLSKLIIDNQTKNFIYLEILQSGHMILDNENTFPYIRKSLQS
ncbi:alpha/beta fold hydrolase [Rhizosphaericola mali]|uniref:Alpha/beta hydrolase n=1 Tax=Rhizosphaericola mali TaxID=2545455 RepID=A0A5P2G870_9BACT|nr:alpha/beta hydrolase [Rhizosphaericola mali]QES87721.1 alpha/beta hydrolase [Rhizosphaericola mali]